MSRLITQQPNSPEAEQYRAWRGRLLSTGHTTFSLVAPHDGIDTAVVMANLALSVAQSGRSVSLIEANLRQPGLATLLRLSDEIGLADALAQNGDEIDIRWQESEVAHLHLLGAGQAESHPADLLLQPRMEQFLAHVRRTADVVLLHLPPLSYPEAAWLAGLSDGVLLLAQRGRTKRRDLAQARKSLAQAKAEVLGALFIH